MLERGYQNMDLSSDSFLTSNQNINDSGVSVYSNHFRLTKYSPNSKSQLHLYHLKYRVMERKQTHLEIKGAWLQLKEHIIKTFGTHLLVNSPQNSEVVYLFSQRRVKQTTLYLDPGKVSSESKKLEEVQATSQSQQILEICFSESLDFDSLCKAGFQDTLREQR